MESGIVNGSMGTINHFTTNNLGNVHSLYIKLDNNLTVDLERSKVNFEVIKGIFVQREQFAISLAYAITIHKSQGLSLTCAMIDIGPALFQSINQDISNAPANKISRWRARQTMNIIKKKAKCEKKYNQF